MLQIGEGKMGVHVTYNNANYPIIADCNETVADMI